MIRTARCFILVLAMAFILGATAQGQIMSQGIVNVSWTDGLGTHVEQLSLIDNPMADPNNPLYSNLARKFIFYGEIDIYCSLPQDIVIDIVGDFSGSGVSIYDMTYYDNTTEYGIGLAWDVILRENMINQTGAEWTDFSVSVEELTDDVPMADPTFSQIISWGVRDATPAQPADWTASVNLADAYYGPTGASSTETIPYGGSSLDPDFFDEMQIGTTIDGFNDYETGMRITKSFTPVPEPGTAVALSGGLLGIVAMIRRRKQ